MTSSTADNQNYSKTRMRRLLGVAATVLICIGPFFSDNSETLLSYLLVLCACLLPCAIWLLGNTMGVPVLPAVAFMYFIYYAVPILRTGGDIREVTGGPDEILNAGITVSLFLFAATAAWWLALRVERRRKPLEFSDSDLVSDIQLNKVIIVGLAFGVIYYVALWSGWLNSLSSALGTVRSVALAAASVSCFLLGHARAKGSIQGKMWTLAAIELAAMVFLELGGLFLVLAMAHVFAALMGYMITARRIPWRVGIAAFLILSVLQAGKVEMRQKLWSSGGGAFETTLTDVPTVMSDWVVAGISSFGDSSSGPGIVDRASLLHLLMRVERIAPDHIPYLGGESYVLLPSMLIPRFISPDKISSQSSMTLLNVYFGIQTAEAAQFTSIGWGPIAEAYGNFGRIGVITVGLLLGLFSGLLTRWSSGAPVLSLRYLIAVAGLVTGINAESDMSYMIVNFFQTSTSIAVFYWFIREFVATRTKQRKPSAAVQHEYIRQ